MFQPSKQHRNEDEIGHRLTLVLYYYLMETDQTRRWRMSQDHDRHQRRRNWHVFGYQHLLCRLLAEVAGGLVVTVMVVITSLLDL